MHQYIYGIIKLKLIDVNYNTYTDSVKDVNDKDPKCKVGNHVRILRFKYIFAKGYTPNWSGEVFVIQKDKNRVS